MWGDTGAGYANPDEGLVTTKSTFYEAANDTTHELLWVRQRGKDVLNTRV